MRYITFGFLLEKEWIKIGKKRSLKKESCQELSTLIFKLWFIAYALYLLPSIKPKNSL
tara:strand:+ start:1964 stop:2137 length:174 start_codon:yes stop_codon:yes gene_type:complete